MLVLSLFVLATALSAQESAKPMQGQKQMGENKEPVVLQPSDVKWGAVPPGLPKGGQMGVVMGDPTKSGAYVLRLKLPDGYKIPPHWHTMDENLTILAGTFVLHMGDTMDAPSHDLKVGAYHFLPAKMHHAAEAKGETIVQVHGMGPFDIHYLNPSDDPRNTAAR
jgi:quercetin dioxygenase-like cupin family protein